MAHITNLTTLSLASNNVEELNGFYANFESTLRSIVTRQITLHEASVVIRMSKNFR